METVEVQEITIIVIKAIIAIAMGVFAGNSLVFVFNHVPATWLCEYNEQPAEELKEKGKQRIKSVPWKYALSAFFSAAGLYVITLGGHNIEYILPVIISMWLLMMIAFADAKYMIIPDQFVIFLILISAGFIPFGSTLKDMLLGAAIGAGIMFVTGLMGRFIVKKEALGFGDVKLMVAIGMLSGFYGCIGIMAAASIAAGIWFMVGMARGNVKKGDMKPLGPFLAGAAMLYLLVF